MNQLELLYDYNYDTRKRFNDQLLKRDDDAIYKEVLKVIKACERDGFFKIQLVSHKVIDDPMEIHRLLRENEEKRLANRRKKNKSIENPYDFINLKDTDMRLLIVEYIISVKGDTELLSVYIAIPKIVMGNCFKILGNVYTPMYQIVDGSTYNNNNRNRKSNAKKKDTVTLKTMFGPIKVYRTFIKLKTVDKKTIDSTLYTARVFSKLTHSMKIILGRYGLYGSLDFLKLQFISISNSYDESELEDNYIFNKKANPNIFIKTPKVIFDNDAMTQNFISTIIDSINKNTKYESIFTNDYWLSILGKDFGKASPDRGASIQDSFEGLYDLSTKEDIALPLSEKQDIYHVFRWMLREFSNLKIKDNLDVTTKKVRYAEYIASYYAMKLARGIHRISDMNKRAGIKDIKRAIYTDPLLLIRAVTKSTLVNYKNSINDLDFSALKFTFKGPSGLGEGKKTTVPDSTRRVYPEYIGILDMDTSSPSDPGLSGMICPYATLHGNKLTGVQEPLTWEEEYVELTNNYKKLKGIKEIIKLKEKIIGETDDEYLNIIENSILSYSKLIKPVYFITKTTEEVVNPIQFK